MRLSEVVDTARRIIQDEKFVNGVEVTPRYSDEDMALFANHALKRVAVLRPDLFITQATPDTCLVGSTPTPTLVAKGGVLQSAPTDSLRFVELVSSMNGMVSRTGENTYTAADGLSARTVTESSRETMDYAVPGWANSSADGATQHFMRYPRSPNQFYIYPPAPEPPANGATGMVTLLSMSYSQSPRNYTYAETTEIDLLPEAYLPAVIDATVWVIESSDSEYADQRRATVFYKSFTDALAVSTNARQIIDNESGGAGDDQITQIQVNQER